MLAGKALGLTDALMVSGVGIVVVMAELALIAVLVFLLSRIVRTLAKKGGSVDVVEIEPTSKGGSKSKRRSARKPEITGHVELYGTDEVTAATIMATVSHQTGKPLQHLDFKSIKLLETPLELINVDEPTAAVIMALTSHQTGIPLERLEFRRIQLMEFCGIDEPTAAVIMALVSHQTGIPLNRLDFKSIKLIEE